MNCSQCFYDNYNKTIDNQMGTSVSSHPAEKTYQNFYSIIDFIASDYILTMKFKNLKKCANKEYCDKLVVLTANLIQQHFTTMDIDYLAQRVQNGEEINQMNHAKVSFANKDILVSPDSQLRQKRVCIGIAKFYVKIAHIFSAIMMTINPTYRYRDETTGKMVNVEFMNKDTIPANSSRTILKLNVCDNRIRALSRTANKQNEDLQNADDASPVIDTDDSSPALDTTELDTSLNPIGLSDTSLNPIGLSDTSLNPISDTSLNPMVPMGPSLNPMVPMGPSLNPMVPMGPSLNPMVPMGPSLNPISDTSLNPMVPMGPSLNPMGLSDTSLNPMGPMGPSQRDQRGPRDPQKDAGNLMKGGDNTTTTTIRPSICSMNRQSDGQLKTLNDEPGFVELMQLYLDDKYDYSTGEFTGMSDNTQAQFNRDLKAVYTEFTGNATMPDTIKSFSDILLRDYGSLDGCVNGTYSKPYEINTNGTLMVQFANNTRQMIARASENQSKLLSVINILFVHSVKDGKPSVSVNPQLTDAILQKATEQARSLILALYMSCEQDYARGVKMYQAIVEAKLLQTGINQIHALRKDERELLKELS